MPCASHSELTALLEKHGESQVAAGLTSGGGLLEVFATEDGSTFTIVITTPHGTSCVVESGRDWDTRKQISEGEGA